MKQITSNLSFSLDRGRNLEKTQGLSFEFRPIILTESLDVLGGHHPQPVFWINVIPSW